MKVKVLFTIIISILLSSCNSTKQLPCKMNPIKHKKYRVKQKNQRKLGSYSSRVNKTKQLPAQPNPVQQNKITVIPNSPPEQISPKSENVVTTTKTTSTKVSLKDEEPENLEEVVSKLKTNEIHSFDRRIEYINGMSLFLNKADAQAEVDNLIKVLKEDSTLIVTIIGNTASTRPISGTKYGSSPDVYSQVASFPGEPIVTLYDIMMDRANQVKDLLIQNGVPEQQIVTKPGAHKQYAKDRVVSFELKRKE